MKDYERTSISVNAHDNVMIDELQETTGLSLSGLVNLAVRLMIPADATIEKPEWRQEKAIYRSRGVDLDPVASIKANSASRRSSVSVSIVISVALWSLRDAVNNIQK